MDELKKRLKRALIENQKSEAVRLMEKALNDGLSVIVFYEEILSPILQSIECDNDDYACIWLEHQMSAIARSLVEISYRFIHKKDHKLAQAKHVLVVCPDEEYHELGALMGAYMLESLGFNTTFLGANTPLATLDLALKKLNPDYLVLSVSNPYNLFEVNKVLTHLKYHHSTIKVLGAGVGFNAQKENFKDVYIIKNAASLVSFIEEEGL